jgi:ribokinase
MKMSTNQKFDQWGAWKNLIYTKGVRSIEKKYDVVTIADLCVDLALAGKDVVPEFMQKEKLIDNYVLELGGSCSIFASQTAKLGLRTAVVGVVGNDFMGEFVIKRLKESGVDTDYISVRDHVKTGLGVAICKKNDRAILTYLGSIDEMNYADIPFDLISSAKHLHIGSYFLLQKIRPYILEIIRFAKSHGASVSLDTNWDPEEEWDSSIHEILENIDIFLPNENEIKAIMRENDLHKALELASKVVPITSVKMGPKGAILKKGNCIIEMDAWETDYIDGIGAGDSFDAGFIYGYVNNLDLKKCLQIGSICGSLNITEVGGLKGQPDYNMLWSLLDTCTSEASVL